MNCTVCGNELQSTIENHVYDECGLTNVVLSGVAVNRCGSCGEFEIELPDIEGLHRVIAWSVATERRRLTHEELRFLRKYLGFSQRDAAVKLGISHETLSRYENGRTETPWTIEFNLRLLTVVTKPLKKYDFSSLGAELPAAPPAPEPLRVTRASRHWSAPTHVTHAHA